MGLDVSDEMIRRARAASTDYDNLMFVVGSAQQIPWDENFFDKVLSVESFYYYADQERALAELFRVMAPKGELFILINLYKDNPYSLRWVDELKVPVQARSEQEYVDLLKAHTFEEVRALRIPDLTPTPEEYSGSAVQERRGVARLQTNWRFVADRAQARFSITAARIRCVLVRRLFALTIVGWVRQAPNILDGRTRGPLPDLFPQIQLSRRRRQ